MKVSRYLFVSVFFAGLLVLSSTSAKADAFSITVSVDENGHGTVSNTNGASLTLPFALLPDAGPGGLGSALTYNLINPPLLTIGDLIILDSPGVVSDIIRFSSLNGGSLVFYSTLGEGSLADTGFPTALNTNTFTVFEVNGGVVYTPTEGQPGFVAAAGGPVTYRITSSTVPEPGSLILFGTGLTGAVGFWRRRYRA